MNSNYEHRKTQIKMSGYSPEPTKEEQEHLTELNYGEYHPYAIFRGISPIAAEEAYKIFFGHPYDHDNREKPTATEVFRDDAIVSDRRWSDSRPHDPRSQSDRKFFSCRAYHAKRSYDDYLSRELYKEDYARKSPDSIFATVIEKDEETGTIPCVICDDKKSQLAPLECGHLCLCFACADKIIKSSPPHRCPKCRKAIKKKMFRVFY